MASFYGLSFVYNNISSQVYGLTLSFLNGNGTTDSVQQEMNVTTARASRRQSYYMYGVNNTEPLSFDIEFYSEEPLYEDRRHEIINWLSNNGQLGKLYINQPDMQSKYYLCLFKKISGEFIGNLCYGFKATLLCDSPYCYGDQITTTISSGITSFNLLNSSSAFMPIPLSIDASVVVNTDITLTNSTTNQSFTQVSLLQGEIFHIDSNLFIIQITGNSSKNIVDNFSGNFITLATGNNAFTYSGKADLTLTYTPVYTIGG